MASVEKSPRGRPALTWSWLLCIALQIQLASAAVSTLFINDTNTQISINLPPDSDDVNFYISSPDWYQYTAIGFGSSMANSLILVMYSAADTRRITVSPRFTTGNTEPVFSPSVKLTIHGTSAIRSFDMIVNATCHGCRSWATGSIDAKSTTQPMIFANGPGIPLNSDDPAAGIRRHIGYGRFNMDMVRATGAGGIGTPSNATVGAALVGDGIYHVNNKAATAHGVVFVIAALIIAPFDSLVAGALSRWPTLHAFSATFYLLFVIGALVPGIIVSREHVATQNFGTPHQVLGLLTVAAMGVMFFWGIVLAVIRKGAKNRGQDPPEKSRVLSLVHRWVGRLVWLLFIINGGIGLKLAERSHLFLMGYGVLTGGMVVFLLPIYFCVWRYSRHKREKQEEDSHELHNTQPSIYNHDY
ncbi:hypothetical protein B0T25DRAFT_206131 [Lasiosphaeria hispida]|uniref:DOMON domain-containing protein n=1 Tax=Lasiosphaeria hispida TaxID=260671 RepID=A0AAJ0HII6_9PEZI|nr:hypothetical protein B0T25DRAFT_206131 [Lasiosphaeria hispida]